LIKPGHVVFSATSPSTAIDEWEIANSLVESADHFRHGDFP